MIKKKLHTALKAVLSEFVFGFTDDQLDVGLFSGQVELKDLIIKPDKVNKIFEKENMPIRLKAGMIALIRVKVS